MPATWKSNLLTATYSIILFFLLLHIAKLFRALGTLLSVLTPFFVGFLFAYLLDGLYLWFREKAFASFRKHKFWSRFQKPLALFMTYFLLVLALGLFLALILPQLAQSAQTLVKNFPSYLDSFQSMTGKLQRFLQSSTGIYAQLEKWGEKLQEGLNTTFSSSLPQVYGMTKNFAVSVFNLLIGMIVSAYLLSEKERLKLQVKKISCALLPQKVHHKATCIVRLTDCVFNSFVRGQLIDSLIIACLTFLAMWIFRMPYPLLNSAIIGLTNIIPIFGPFIGAVPTFFIVLMAQPSKALWFLLLVFILQQIEGNLIAPKIVGDSIGLSGLWVIFAITVGGGLFGFIGVLIGIPVFAVIYKLAGAAVEQRLKHSTAKKS